MLINNYCILLAFDLVSFMNLTQSFLYKANIFAVPNTPV